MGKHLGVKFQTVSLWLNGKTTPEIKHLKPLSDYFGVSIDYLLCNSNVMTSNVSVKTINKQYGLDEYTLNCLKNIKSEENDETEDNPTIEMLNLLFSYSNKKTGKQILYNGILLMLMYNFCFVKFKDIQTEKYSFSEEFQDKFALELICEELIQMKKDVLGENGKSGNS
jgi:hypothetical protein